MENKLVEILENINLDFEFDVKLQGTLDIEEECPESYFTYWCWDNARSKYYDNKHNVNYIGYQIIAYSTDRATVIEMITRAVEELEKNGFDLEDDPVDYHTSRERYTAKMIDIYYTKKREE